MSNDSVEELQRHSRRVQLQQYARQELSGTNKAQAFINIVVKAAQLVRLQSIPRPASEMINDIEKVLIGEGYREGEGLWEGPYYVGNYLNYNGASGFKPELRDEKFQVHHAAAGLVIGFKYGKPGEWFARIWEGEDQDDALYMATAPIGTWLAEESVLDGLQNVRTALDPGDARLKPLFYDEGDAYRILPALLLMAICDDSCELPSAEDLQIHTYDSNNDTVPDTSLPMSAPDDGSPPRNVFEQALYPTSLPDDGVDSADVLEDALYPTSLPDDGGASEDVSYPTCLPDDDSSSVDASDDAQYQISLPDDSDDGSDEQSPDSDVAPNKEQLPDQEEIAMGEQLPDQQEYASDAQKPDNTNPQASDAPAEYDGRD